MRDLVAWLFTNSDQLQKVVTMIGAVLGPIVPVLIAVYAMRRKKRVAAESWRLELDPKDANDDDPRIMPATLFYDEPELAIMVKRIRILRPRGARLAMPKASGKPSQTRVRITFVEPWRKMLTFDQPMKADEYFNLGFGAPAIEQRSYSSLRFMVSLSGVARWKRSGRARIRVSSERISASRSTSIFNVTSQEIALSPKSTASAA